jgi:hydrogenase expression/formation protein HypC
MCLAIPGSVETTFARDGVRFGRVAFGGIRRDVCLEYLPEAVVGDFVLVHVGFALSVVDPEEARRTFEALAELGGLTELDAPPIEPPVEPRLEEGAS